jgi:TolB-like protein
MALILCVFAFGTPLSAFGKPLQVAIVPFKVNAEKDLSFLKDGIVDMLSSRLYWEDNVNIINRQATEKAAAAVGGPLNEGKARTLGTQLGADYVLFGSLTVFGNSVSIDAKMVDVSGKRKTLTFFNQSQSMDQVIPGINLFASDINEKEFGRVMETRQVAPAAGPSPATQAGLPQTDARAHPDKLIAGGIAGSELQKGQKEAPGSAFITTEMARSQGTKFWKSRNIKQRITGMAIGDIDGDGKKETVFSTEHTVEAYRYDNQRFIKINTLAERNLDHLIGVDVADINGNGVAEIYVSALDPYRKYVKSFVIEFNGKSYAEIVKTTDWYLRVVDMPQRGKVLIGQKQGLESPFDKPIFELVWQNSGYDPAERVLGAKRANVIGLSLGHVMNDGSEAIVVYDELDYLRMYDLSGR